MTEALPLFVCYPINTDLLCEDCKTKIFEIREGVNLLYGKLVEGYRCKKCKVNVYDQHRPQVEENYSLDVKTIPVLIPVVEEVYKDGTKNKEKN
jgi:hypothetical protein